MSPLRTLEAAPQQRLAAFGVVEPAPTERSAQPVAPAMTWDNRPSWDNWSRR
ncbi:hypothetical protein [Nocardioides speluncae]|uniref:hypothetical protein n=1 Tax=Nocardioides speluncae TaxID=2670337 RepID=UPI0012B184E5|nr:hypothetical protein [Nocardioides speluncae]